MDTCLIYKMSVRISLFSYREIQFQQFGNFTNHVQGIYAFFENLGLYLQAN